MTPHRAGRYVQQVLGYAAYIPAELPPDPPISITPLILSLLSRADQAVGRLDGVTATLPNPDLFVAMYVRREAVLSSQIEGTQSSLDDVLQFELDPHQAELPRDVEEVVNYVRALNYGLDRLTSLPLSLRLIREIHEHLMKDVRGADCLPGEFRRSQNWIGPANAPIERATFVPPSVDAMTEALANLEQYLHLKDEPALLQCAIAHAQFETIHPFLDGNGRVGRLLIAFLLVYRSVLGRPLLYLSYYLKGHRTEYYDRLMAVRESGDWEGWLAFFLRGVGEIAEESVQTAHAILKLRDQHRTAVQGMHKNTRGLLLLDLLFEQPLINVHLVMDRLSLTYPLANKLVGHFVAAGILQEMTGARRNRRFRYTAYLALFTDEGLHMDEASLIPEITSNAAMRY